MSSITTSPGAEAGWPWLREPRFIRLLSLA